MRFPEWLYKLLAGDAGTQQLGVIWRENSAVVANVAVGATVYTVPTDKSFVLTNATAIFQPGGAQLVQRARVMIDPPDGSKRYDLVQDATTGGAGQWRHLNWSGEVVVPGGWKVRVEGDFNAGAVGNTVNCEIHGYLIPRGSFNFG